MNKLKALFALSALALCCLPAASAAAQAADVVTVGSVVANSAIVDVPIYIRDVSGTPLGVDQPVGNKLQSYSITVNYAPSASVSSAGIARAGITASLTPLFENAPAGPGTAAIVDTFYEPTNPIPFVSNAAAPGNQVAHLQVQLSPSVTPGSVITLTLDPTLTQLSNDGGTTTETVNAGNLALVSGTITIPSTFVYEIPTMSQWMLVLLAITLSVVALRVRL